MECTLFKSDPRNLFIRIEAGKGTPEKTQVPDKPKRCRVGSTKKNPVAYDPPENIKTKYCTTSNFKDCPRFRAAPPWQKGKEK